MPKYNLWVPCATSGFSDAAGGDQGAGANRALSVTGLKAFTGPLRSSAALLLSGVGLDQVAIERLDGRLGQSQFSRSAHAREITEPEDETIPVLGLLKGHERQAGGLDA